MPTEPAPPVPPGPERARVTHPDKVLYPDGTTKADAVAYVRAASGPLLAQLAGRPVTRVRFPDGVGGERFFEKNVPRGTPDWVRRRVVRAAATEGKEVTFPFLDDVEALVWVTNLGALELHTPQWRVGPRGGVRRPDRFVVDLDPGEGAGLPECARVARLVADRLAQDGLTTVPVTSGSKGLQLYAPLDGRRTATAVHRFARDLGEHLAAEHPDLIVAVQRRTERAGRVLLDWSQNHPAKTTITPYSLRGRERPTVAAPRTWAELEDPGLAQLTPAQVLARLADLGDLMAA